jgi:hypothetical protein
MSCMVVPLLTHTFSHTAITLPVIAGQGAGREGLCAQGVTHQWRDSTLQRSAAAGYIQAAGTTA